jgi:hypothetical protein
MSIPGQNRQQHSHSHLDSLIASESLLLLHRLVRLNFQQPPRAIDFDETAHPSIQNHVSTDIGPHARLAVLTPHIRAEPNNEAEETEVPDEVESPPPPPPLPDNISDWWWCTICEENINPGLYEEGVCAGGHSKADAGEDAKYHEPF